MTNIPDNVLDEIEGMLKIYAQSNNHALALLAKLRDARKAEPAPAMSAETMREKAASVADKCAEQNKAAAIKLRKRQNSETDTWNSNELDDTAAEAKAIAVMIRALPLTETKEDGK